MFLTSSIRAISFHNFLLTVPSPGTPSICPRTSPAIARYSSGSVWIQANAHRNVGNTENGYGINKCGQKRVLEHCFNGGGGRKEGTQHTTTHKLVFPRFFFSSLHSFNGGIGIGFISDFYRGSWCFFFVMLDSILRSKRGFSQPNGIQICVKATNRIQIKTTHTKKNVSNNTHQIQAHKHTNEICTDMQEGTQQHKTTQKSHYLFPLISRVLPTGNGAQ